MRHIVSYGYLKRKAVLNKTTCKTLCQKAFYFINEYFIEPPQALITALTRLDIDTIKFR